MIVLYTIIWLVLGLVAALICRIRDHKPFPLIEWIVLTIAGGFSFIMIIVLIWIFRE
jgi:hypothetical protein